jgi:hypothetical protein
LDTGSKKWNEKAFFRFCGKANFINTKFRLF